MKLPKPWMDFLAELEGDEYRSFLRRMLGGKSSLLTFEWHYAWQGLLGFTALRCRAENCDPPLLFQIRKIGSPEWGGQTLVLEDETSKFATHSAPTSEDLNVVGRPIRGQQQLIFGRTPIPGWSRPLNCRKERCDGCSK